MKNSLTPRPAVPAACRRTALAPLPAATDTGTNDSIHYRSHRWLPLVMLACMALRLSAGTFGNLTYTDNGTSITITDYPTNLTGEVVIPATINGKPVTGIGAGAFLYCLLTSVTIPAGVTSIGEHAFYLTNLNSVTIPATVRDWGGRVFEGCSGLQSVTMSEGLTSIGDLAFLDCSRLASVTIPASVTDIGDGAFLRCRRLASVTISEGLITIGDAAFFECQALTGVTIPASVTSIGSSAFCACSALTSMRIPASVTSIGDAAFARCSGLTSIAVDAGNPNYSAADGVLFDKSQTTLLQCLAGRGGNYPIPASVTRIGSEAFRGCSGLTGVTIPAGVTSIGDYAFDGCSGLTSLTIPAGVTRIGEGTFATCSGLTSLTIPSRVTSVGDFAFAGCRGLTSITIPASVTSIGKYAFNNCTRLTGVRFPASVTSIGEGAFIDCSALEAAIFMGNAPESMASSVFDAAASGFTVYYFVGRTGFTTPTWNGYPALLAPPMITLEQPTGSAVAAGGTRDFGAVPVGNPATMVFTIRNTGLVDLTGLRIGKDGANSGDFVVSPPGTDTLALEASTTFVVTFTPSAPGTRLATLHITNNVESNNPFNVRLVGTGYAPHTLFT